MAELAYDLAPTEDDRLDQAEGLVRSYCGWHIAPPVTETVTVRGTGSVVILKSLRVTDVVSVTDDGTLVPADDYDWSEAGVLTRIGCAWGCRQIVVEFTHGYDSPPAEVTAVVQALAQRAISNPGGPLKSWTRGPFSETYGSDGGLAVGDPLSVLDRYKLPPRP